MLKKYFDRVRAETENALKDYFLEEGLEFHSRKNDNLDGSQDECVLLYAISGKSLQNNPALIEAAATLDIISTRHSCRSLAESAYLRLQGMDLESQQINILLMSLQTEELEYPFVPCHRVVIRMIFETATVSAASGDFHTDSLFSGRKKEEYC